MKPQFVLKIKLTCNLQYYMISIDGLHRSTFVHCAPCGWLQMIDDGWLLLHNVEFISIPRRYILS
uniref:Uncharacterized protein n=1 Tax=Oryza meridionalis TaxID=40149 RepID=A0A0E0CL57_9ORYZ